MAWEIPGGPFILCLNAGAFWSVICKMCPFALCICFPLHLLQIKRRYIIVKADIGREWALLSVGSNPARGEPLNQGRHLDLKRRDARIFVALLALYLIRWDNFSDIFQDANG